MDTNSLTEKSEEADKRDEQKDLAEDEGSGLGLLEDEKLLATDSQEDPVTWRQRMDENEDMLKKRKETFEKWHDGIVRRRMFAYSRMQKLQNCFRQRLAFYSDVSKVIEAVAMTAGGDSRKVTFATHGSNADLDHSAVQPHQLEEEEEEEEGEKQQCQQEQQREKQS